jgi:cobaltochelatase CobS
MTDTTTEVYNPKETGITFELGRTQWVKELCDIVRWDPYQPGVDHKVDINTTKLTHLVKRFLMDSMTDADIKELESSYGDTLYKICAKHLNYENMFVIVGLITPQDYIKASMTKPSGDFFDPMEDNVKTVGLTILEVMKQVTERQSMTDEVVVSGRKMVLPPPASLTAINALLGVSDLPNLEFLFDELGAVEMVVGTANAEVDKYKKDLKASAKALDKLKDQYATLSIVAESASTNVEYTTERTEIPDGKVVTKKASEIWPDIKLTKDFDVPFWEWEGTHPDVPQIDPEYIFRPKHLGRALYALITNQREYIQGHTGTGKTTLVEQIAAHLNWPFLRINFDSEITRMDLIGRDTLTSDDDGKIISEFVDGMLPTAMAGPYITCFDELDFVRPDVAYVMQAALEGNGLRITEDGDRLVQPHPMFRMFGTGNTVGQGDEHGMYQGARPQSIAFLDRFTVWDRIDYLTDKERESLVDRKFPALDTDDKKMILQYTTEHLEAFKQSKVIQPISPRGMLAICKATMMLGSVREALSMSVLDRANIEDRATLSGLVDRCTKK